MSYLGIPGNHTGKTFDKFLELVPDGTTLTNGTPSAAIYIGEGLIDADLVLDFATVTVAESGTSSVTLQFSKTADFADVVSGASLTLTSGMAGRVVLPFRNDIIGAPLPYVRLMPAVSTALKAGAFIAKK